MNPLALGLPVAAYLLGSVSPAWIAGRVRGIDLRQHGSRNLGATNAGRVLGRRWFFIVFACDVLKGLLPVLAARWLATERFADDAAWLPLATAAGAVLGHSFTCFHGFKGGKAVATSLGVLIGLMPLVAGAAFGCWLLAWILGWLVLRLPRSEAVGPASVLAAIAVPVLRATLEPQPWAPAQLPLTCFAILLATLVVVRHRSNLRRLVARWRGVPVEASAPAVAEPPPHP